MDNEIIEHAVEEAQQIVQGKPKELSEFEQEQQQKGWNPDGPKSAEEWSRSEPLYEELKKRGKENKQLQRTVESMKALMDKQEKLAYQRALADLESQRRIAISNGNHQTVDQIDRQKQELKAPEITPPGVQEFTEKHSKWLNGTSYEDMKMVEFAKRRDDELGRKKLDPEAHMQLLEEHIIKEFPDYFKTTGEKSATLSSQSVEGGSSGVVGSSKKKYTLRDLSDEQKQVARDFERMGVMPVDKYISELIKIGDLK